MRFSVLALPVLALGVSAWRHDSFHHGNFNNGDVTQSPPCTTGNGGSAPTTTPSLIKVPNSSNDNGMNAPKSSLGQDYPLLSSILVQTTFLTQVSSTAPSTPSGTPSTGGGDLTRDQQNALDAHNQARKVEGVAFLKWSASLANEAQSWAQQLANEGKMYHSGVKGQGENLAGSWNSAADPTSPCLDAVNGWVAEKGSSGETGHFTQVVWKDTTEVGMGVAKSSVNGWTYVVARYTPQGNVNI